MRLLTWKALGNSKIEMALVVIVLIIAAIMAVFKPFDPITVGYFTDWATVLLLFVAVLLFVVGVKRSVM